MRAMPELPGGLEDLEAQSSEEELLCTRCSSLKQSSPPASHQDWRRRKAEQAPTTGQAELRSRVIGAAGWSGAVHIS